MSSHPDRVRRNYAEAVATEEPINMTDEGEVSPLLTVAELVTVVRGINGFTIMAKLADGTLRYTTLSQDDIYRLIRLVHSQTTGEPA